MILHILAFTPRGTLLARELADGLTQKGHSCKAASFRPFADEKGRPVLPAMERETLSGWTQAAFREAGGIIFVSACAIAVRAVAPFLQSKHTDPAVVAVDEAGAFAVSLLSGHTGGANRLAEEIAALTGGTPVVTTATDRAGLLALAGGWSARSGSRNCPPPSWPGRPSPSRAISPSGAPCPRATSRGRSSPRSGLPGKGGRREPPSRSFPPPSGWASAAGRGPRRSKFPPPFSPLWRPGASPLWRWRGRPPSP